MMQMFSNCKKLNSVTIDGGETGFPALTTMRQMFQTCESITSALINEDGDADVKFFWGDFSKLSTMHLMFQKCKNLTDAIANLTKFSALSDIGAMFEYTGSSVASVNGNNETGIKLIGDFANLTEASWLFKGNTNLTKAEIKGDFPKLSNMQDVFHSCSKIVDVTLEGNFPILTNIKAEGFFKNCSKLESIRLDGDFSSFTNNTITTIFNDVKSVLASVTLQGNWESVTSAKELFKDFAKLTSATIDGFDNATSFEAIFQNCSKLSDVSLAGDFSNVTTTKNMFDGATNVSTISITGTTDSDTADFTSLTNAYRMFNNWTDDKFDVILDAFSQIKLDSSVFKGGETEAYKINDNKSFTTTSPVTTKNSMVYNVGKGKYLMFDSEATSALLPIELALFIVEENGGFIKFEWETKTETNNDYFTIEQSIDGVSFHEMAWIAGAGTSSTSNFYEYSISTTFSGFMYFRLKQTDYNGDYSYSNIQAINVGNSEYIRLYPTIATDFITIEGDYENVKFSNEQGKIQHPTRMHGNSYPIAALPQGMHYAIISLKNGEIVTRQFFRK